MQRTATLKIGRSRDSRPLQADLQLCPLRDSSAPHYLHNLFPSLPSHTHTNRGVSRDLWRARSSKKQCFTPRIPPHTSGTERALLWAAPPGKPVAKDPAQVLQGLTQLPESGPRAMISISWTAKAFQNLIMHRWKKKKKSQALLRRLFCTRSVQDAACGGSNTFSWEHTATLQ